MLQLSQPNSANTAPNSTFNRANTLSFSRFILTEFDSLRCKDTTLFLLLQIPVALRPLLSDTEFGEDVVEDLLGCDLTCYLTESGEAVLQVHTQELAA